jgi:hypothetical protein
MSEDIDCAVYHRDELYEKHAALFPKPWIVDYPDGSKDLFDTEDEECERQRLWRRQHGLDEMTGRRSHGTTEGAE